MSRAARLSLVRMAMLGGVLMFGGISWYVHHAGGAPVAPPGEAQQDMLRWIGYAAWGVALTALGVLRTVFSRTTDPAKLATVAIIGWALGESVALYGAVILFLSGDGQMYITGLIAMLITFSLFPLPRR